MDDSTSAVDTTTDALIREAFRTKIPDTTKIIISQRVSSLQDADQIMVLDKGHLVAIEECIAAAKLARADGFINHLENGYNTVIDASGEFLS